MQQSNGGNGRQSVGLIAAHVLVSLSVIGAVTLLVAIGKMNQEASVTLFGAAIGLTGGAAGAIVAARLGVIPQGSTVVTPSADKTSTQTTITTNKPGE